MIPRARFRKFRAGLASLAASLLAIAAASADERVATGPAVIEAGMQSDLVSRMVRMSGPELDDLYRRSGMGTVPSGKVRGTAIFSPGSARAVPMSKATRFMWQGKVFLNADNMAVNKFFGLRAIKANVYQGSSWLDGNPSIILDYSETSRIYANYRDEIRQVGPGLYLGIMYARTAPPTVKMYFVLETLP